MKQLIVDGCTALYGIIGNPVNHSFSPDMQTRAFQHTGINAVYLPFPVAESDLPGILDAFRLLGVRGFNVTVPYKQKIIGFLEHLSEEAGFLSSVNTVKWTGEGWMGFSTDGSGFVKSLADLDFNPQNKRVVLLGAGGAARAIVYALVKEGIKHLTLFNRTLSRAKKLAELAGSVNPQMTVSINPGISELCDLLVNSTSVGMEEDHCPVSLKQIGLSRTIVDIIYNPPRTTLLEEAEKRGIPNRNGIGMLLYQGLESFEIWTGQEAPKAIMEQSLNKSLAIV